MKNKQEWLSLTFEGRNHRFYTLLTEVVFKMNVYNVNPIMNKTTLLPLEL